MSFGSFLLGCLFTCIVFVICIKIRVNKLKKAGLMSDQRRQKKPFNQINLDVDVPEEVDSDD